MNRYVFRNLVHFGWCVLAVIAAFIAVAFAGEFGITAFPIGMFVGMEITDYIEKRIYGPEPQPEDEERTELVSIFS